MPLIPVHHLAGHIESLVLENGEMPLPAVVLVVSGGHTSLYRVAEPWRYRLLGRTRDDAAGEAYDKVAKLLGLGYPGGPGHRPPGRARATTAPIRFPKTRLTHADRNAPHLPGRRDFSFSGLKTSVLRHVTRRRERARTGEGRSAAGMARSRTSAPAFSAWWSRRCSTDCFEAAREHGARSVGIAGGVSANRRLREEAWRAGESRELPVFIPTLALSTDNAAMIAAAGPARLRASVRGTIG